MVIYNFNKKNFIIKSKTLKIKAKQANMNCISSVNIWDPFLSNLINAWIFMKQKVQH